jgi:hypothetical protein
VYLQTVEDQRVLTRRPWIGQPVDVSVWLARYPVL